MDKESEAGKPYNEIMQKKVSDVLDYIRVTPELSRVEKVYVPVMLDKSAGDIYELMQNKVVYLAVITDEKGKPTHYFDTGDVGRVLLQFG